MFAGPECEHGLLFFQLQSCLGCLALSISWSQMETENSGEAVWTQKSICSVYVVLLASICICLMNGVTPGMGSLGWGEFVMFPSLYSD